MKTVECKPIKIQITRVINQEEKDGMCTNYFKEWKVSIDNNSMTSTYRTQDRGQILLDILQAMIR